MKNIDNENIKFIVNKNRKEYDIYIVKDGVTIGSFLFSLKNINSTRLEIGFQYFSLEDNNPYKDRYYKIEKALKKSKKSVKIEMFSILSEYQKKGYGKVLFNEGIKYIENVLKIPFIYLEVLPTDENTNEDKLINYYQKNNFQHFSDNNRKFLMFRFNKFEELSFNKNEISSKFLEDDKIINEIEELLKIDNFDYLDDYECSY